MSEGAGPANRAVQEYPYRREEPGSTDCRIDRVRQAVSRDALFAVRAARRSARTVRDRVTPGRRGFVPPGLRSPSCLRTGADDPGAALVRRRRAGLRERLARRLSAVFRTRLR